MKHSSKKFSEGRNGLDLWNYIIFAVDVVLIAVGILAHSYLPFCIAFLLLIIFIYRAMSRNLAKREKENQIFSETGKAIAKQHKLNRLRWTDRKTHVYKKCPACRRVLRVKRRKGPKDIHCPYCNADFKIVIRIPGELDKEEKENRKAEARGKK